MGQQPNIELEISDLPRPIPHPAPARRWKAQRPGDLASPEELPSGAAFGSTGPDPGYVLKLVRARDLVLAPTEQIRSARAAVAALAGVRAARRGRAPTMEDVDVAALVLGYDPEGIPDEVVAGLAKARLALVANLAHSPQKRSRLVAAVPPDVLVSRPEEVRTRMASGERLLNP